MQSTLAILSLMMAAGTALADMQIYTVLNTPTGGGGAAEGYKFYSSQPDCNAPGNAVFHAATDDASSGGVRCKGCNGNQAVADWDIAELEWNINEGHFTVYNMANASTSDWYHKNDRSQSDILVIVPRARGSL
ncbi:uncharacterized protein MYCFIDRAFT_76580 [Pseudocercospora fijiensis CIRAD86]|uniref:Uncharacterized protein n=1 Tax=Pseudocercospora fijiensis (strain CIRAD86) TaxID=383855 RepID=N1QCF2_PSEFD|nr:uncharacterized protein MYCFIDRAFT_76580 [Pseudocercospora fijiensis CIRAD86]EME89227.1 hypothetical protein MYCFIDRAFT_76580 [Pseudocercospora fijiensis CIRAD86]